MPAAAKALEVSPAKSLFADSHCKQVCASTTEKSSDCCAVATVGVGLVIGTAIGLDTPEALVEMKSCTAACEPDGTPNWLALTRMLVMRMTRVV